MKLRRSPKYPRKSVAKNGDFDPYKIIISPIASETTMKKVDESNMLVFMVDIRANKNQIRTAFKKLYNAEVQDVNTLIRPNNTKKAFIKLTPDSDALDIANEIGYI